VFGVHPEGEGGSPSLSGVLYGCLRIPLCLALCHLHQESLAAVHNIFLLSYINVNACILFVPLILFGNELPFLLNLKAVLTVSFWAEMTVGGVFGFAIGYVTGLQIQVTSPLTHNILGTAKAAAQAVFTTQINAEIKSRHTLSPP
jgi:GDP-fucose transporter C1